MIEIHGSLSSLMIVVVLSFFVPIILHRFNLRVIPVVVAEIIVGIIFGKSGFNVIHEGQWLNLLANLGFIYLMFLSGLEIDFSKLMPNQKKKERYNQLYVSIAIFLFILIMSFILSYILFAFKMVHSVMLMMLILSTISLGVVVPVLKEKGIVESELGQTLLLITVLGDFVTMFLLAVFASIASKNSGTSLLILILFALVFVIYRFLNHFTSVPLFRILSKGTVQIGTRGVFTLILFFVFMSETLGVESILGAFLAGIIVSLLSPRKDFVHQLDSFGYGFLIPIFFVMVGTRMDLGTLIKNVHVLAFIPFLLIAMYIAKILPALILKKWYPWKSVLGSGILLSSKLSLVIAASAVALQLKLITTDMNGAIILVSIVTCLISPVIFGKLVGKDKEPPKRMGIIGANRTMLSIIRDFQGDFVVTVYGKRESSHQNGDYPIEEIEELDAEELEKKKAFDNDVVIVGTNDQNLNIQIAEKAKEYGVEKVIARIESIEKHQILQDRDIEPFSDIQSTRMLINSLVRSPSLVHLMTTTKDHINELKLTNEMYRTYKLKELKFLGDVLVLQIYRGNEVVIPHGDTILHYGDRLIVSGSPGNIHEVRRQLER